MKKKKLIAGIIQARMGSTRLHGKAMIHIMGKPILWHIVERLKKSSLIEKIIIATTTNKEDKTILEFATKHNIECFSGSEEDVLDRFYQVAQKFDVEVIVRVTGDCPLIDPEVVDRAIALFINNNLDYVSNTIECTYPDGLDVEVFSKQALTKAWQEAKNFSEREHVTPYIWKHPQIFKIRGIKSEENLSHLRWTIDESQDLKFIKKIYEELYGEDRIFLYKDIINLLKAKPELIKINQGIRRNEGYIKSLTNDKNNKIRG